MIRRFSDPLPSKLIPGKRTPPPVKGKGKRKAGAFSGVVPDGQPPTFSGDIANLYEDMGEGSNEVAKVGFTPEGGRCGRIWQITPENIEDLISAYPAILGSCAYEASGTGKLNRTLPLADPLYSWLYASSMPGIEGYGKYNQVDADPTLEAPGFPKGTLWDQYRLSVESLPRPFPILPDSAINVYTASWYSETAGTVEVDYNVCDEQFRYCTWDEVPQSDYITQQKGTMTFNSVDGANSKGYAAMPRFYLPNSLYTITWYYVPIRLLISPNSYLRRWKGRINQHTMYGPDGLTFEPGELLYLNYSQKMFTPPIQNLVTLGGGGGTIVSTEKFAHITLNFLATKRKLFSAPSVAPTNLNYVVGGHNLMPWNDGNFRYAAVGTPASGGRPSWLSAPLDTLFTDCDSPGGVPV